MIYFFTRKDPNDVCALDHIGSSRRRQSSLVPLVPTPTMMLPNSEPRLVNPTQTRRPTCSATATRQERTARPSLRHHTEVDYRVNPVLPAMADDDCSAQLSWQSLKGAGFPYLFPWVYPISYSIDNLTPEQYERIEASRRHALPK